MSDSAARATELVKKADKKLNSFGFFGNKYEDAAELLEKAAVQYKLAQACASSLLACMCTCIPVPHSLSTIWTQMFGSDSASRTGARCRCANQPRCSQAVA
jgi:hypothetical protein